MQLPTDQVLDLLLSSATFLLCIIFLPVRKSKNTIIFILTLLLILVLVFSHSEIYPYSNLIVLVFAAAGGSLFGKILGQGRGGLSFFLTMLTLSVLDFLSFATGAQNSQAPETGLGSVALEYANFSLRINQNHTFILGSLDLIVLSIAYTFFMEKGRSRYLLLFWGLITMQTPYLYAQIVQPADGIPLIPFIFVCSLPLLIVRRKAVNNVKA
ncbi:MAG: hypothetical protein QXE12_02540 [Conexivisphaerales archaeon]